MRNNNYLSLINIKLQHRVHLEKKVSDDEVLL